MEENSASKALNASGENGPGTEPLAAGGDLLVARPTGPASPFGDPRLWYVGIFGDDLRREAELEELAVAIASKVTTPSRVAAASPPRPAPKFAEVWPRWTGGELAKIHPDHVKKKDTSEDDVARLQVLSLALGELPVVDGGITLDRCDDAMSRLDELRQLHENSQAASEARPPGRVKPLQSGGRRQYAQSLRRVLQLCVYPLKLLSHNPCPRGWLPKKAKPKARGFLYPDEDRKLLAHRAIPVIERLYFGLLNREGMRPDTEGLSLRYGEIDFDHGMLHLDTNKTEARREWPAAEGTIEALAAWRHLCEVEDDKTLVFDVRNEKYRVEFVDAKGRPRTRRPLRRPAENLREALKKAGADRATMHERTEHRIALRAHDLRATFITLALAHGWTEDQVIRRTGHRSSEELRNYRRDASNLIERCKGEVGQELIGHGPTQLLPLWEAIPELRTVVRSGVLPRFRPEVPARGTKARNDKKSTGGETGRRSGFRFRRREA